MPREDPGREASAIFTRAAASSSGCSFPRVVGNGEDVHPLTSQHETRAPVPFVSRWEPERRTNVSPHAGT